MADPRTGIDNHDAPMRATWDAAAPGWDSNGALIGNWLRTSTAAMLDAADIKTGQHVLDVAAGAGEQTIDIARRIGSTGRVVAVDLSPELVARAKVNLSRASCFNAEAHVGNGQTLGFDAAFDSAVCRLGLMFFTDPLAGIKGMRRSLKPGGRVAALVFGGPEYNPLIVEQLAIAARHAGVAPLDPCVAGGLLSLGDPVRLTKLFEQAGFVLVDCCAIAAPMNLPRAQDYVDFLRTAAGPIVKIASGLSNPQRAALWLDLERAFARFQSADKWCGENQLLLVSGSANN